MTAPSHITLDTLSRLNSDELLELFQTGRAPTLSDLDGEPECRALSVVHADGALLAGPVRRLAKSPAFPWAGKTFFSDGETGGGSNRLRVAGNRFPFRSRVGTSQIDSKPAILLDYDLPENPWFIRRVRDELREVSPGLAMGPGLWKSRSKPRVLLYFAVDFGS